MIARAWCKTMVSSSQHIEDLVLHWTLDWCWGSWSKMRYQWKRDVAPLLNLMWPSDSMWCHRTWSALVQVIIWLEWLGSRAVKLPWIFLGAPLIFNGAPANIQGSLTALWGDHGWARCRQHQHLGEHWHSLRNEMFHIHVYKNRRISYL